MNAAPASASTADPTGRRFTLRGDGATAEIAQVGAALRAFQVGAVDLVPRYPDDTPTPAASGVVLVPWPNRIRDGEWTQRGETRKLAVTDRSVHTASHGLLRYTAYQPVAESAASLTLRADVFPQTGYPFQLENVVTYTLSGSSLRVTHRLRNVGTADAPVALGTHPYFCMSDVATQDLTLAVDAESRFLLDERLLPVGEAAVDAEVDLRRPRRLGDVSLNVGYSAVARDDDDRIHGVLTAPDGRTLDLWAGAGFDFLQVYTTDRYPGHPLAVAIEPMTAAPDAFNSGVGLRWLAPGEEWTLEWGVEYSG
jgi:aldose 1-epimerase